MPGANGRTEQAVELALADADRVCSCGYDDSIDMAADKYFEDPYAVVDRLREACPVHWSRTLGGWFLNRYDDVDWCLKSPKLFSSRYHTARQVEVLPAALRERARPLVDMLDGQMIMMQDPPVHTVQRRILNKAFLPKHVASLETGIRAITAERLDKVRDQGSMDFLDEFARPLPGYVLCDFLGVPKSDQERFVAWGDAVTAFIINPDAVASVVDDALAAFDEMATYVQTLLDDPGRGDGGDVIQILNLPDAQGRRLTSFEIVATSCQLLFAGHLTSTLTLATGMYTLLRHPDQLARLVADRSLIPGAVEEILRYFGPVVVIPARTAVAAVERHGQAIVPGEAVFPGLGSAGRDPRRFAEPMSFDVTRPPERHLEFGAGPHVCVGAPVSRIEAVVAFDEIVQRLPGVRLAAEPTWRPMHVVRYPERVLIEW
jgi:cytochrome P450